MLIQADLYSVPGLTIFTKFLVDVLTYKFYLPIEYLYIEYLLVEYVVLTWRVCGTYLESMYEAVPTWIHLFQSREL